MQTEEQLIDLGVASVETQGQDGNLTDLGVEGKPIAMSDED